MADLRHAVITAKMTIVITRRSEMAGYVNDAVSCTYVVVCHTKVFIFKNMMANLWPRNLKGRPADLSW